MSIAIPLPVRLHNNRRVEPVDQHLLTRVDAYIEGLFGKADPALAAALQDAALAGLPAIQVSPGQGRLLRMIAQMAGARRILEIGTLAGYSAIWLARALPEDGKLVTIEFVPAHAEVARKNLERAGLGHLADIRVGDAGEVLQTMSQEPPFDLIFIDADKPGYPRYLELVLPLSHPGTVIMADNLIRQGEVMDETPGDASLEAIRVFNRMLADNPRLDSTILPLFRDSFSANLDGMSISIVK